MNLSVEDMVSTLYLILKNRLVLNTPHDLVSNLASTSLLDVMPTI